MLLFLPADVPAHAPVPPGGLGGAPFRPHATLEAARAASRRPDGQLDRILVLDGHRLERAPDGTVGAVPREAVLNVGPDDDWWRPATVEAGGGYVVRAGAPLDLLLIHRRGVWDLPKGKLDDGETPREAAVREVAEEVGIKAKRLRVLAPLPPTVHGYPWPKRDVYAVKTTHWYAMATTADRFTPETREGIEAVEWAPWAEAGRRLGYDSLRDHHGAIDPDALAARLGETG